MEGFGEESPEQLLSPLADDFKGALRYWLRAKPVAWGPSEFPKPHGQGGIPPFNPHMGISLMAIGWGYGEV